MIYFRERGPTWRFTRTSLRLRHPVATMIEEMFQTTELFSAVGARVGYYDITKTFLDF